MIVFVTGAAGFIGRVFLEQLLRHLAPDAVVRVLVRGPFSVADGRVHPVQGDLQQADEWLPAMQDVNWVFHLGGNATFGDGAHYEAVNVEPVRRMLQALVGSESILRFVFVSSVGAVDRHPSDRLRWPLTPRSTMFPSSDYGRSKLAAEKLVRESGVPYTIIRPGWVYGDSMRKDSHLRALATVLSRSPWVAGIAFPGRVPLIHVKDLASALAQCMNECESVNRTYMAVTENRTLGEIVRLLHEALRGQKHWQIKVPLAQYIVNWLHATLPLKVNVLFSDYLVMEDDNFRAALLPSSPIYIEQGCVDIIAQSRDSPAWWVVTGANSGIGLAITEVLASRGDAVIAVDKCTDDLRESPSMRIVRADLTDKADLARIVDATAGIHIVGLINNAGIGFKGSFADTEEDRIETMVGVNVLAPLRLTHMLLPQLKRSRGVVVNVASSVAYHPLPGMATYAATKAFVLSWSLALGDELRETNPVVTFSPSGTKTAFQNSGGVKGAESSRLFDPSEVAAEVLRAVDRRQRHRLMGWKSQLLVAVSRLLPVRWRLTLWRILFEKLR